MIRVDIYKSDGSIGWSDKWKDQSSANAWITQESGRGSWGVPAIEYVPAISAIPATYSGIPDGATTSINLSANVAGRSGNIDLALDGNLDLETIIASWNTVNPNNTLSLTGNGTQIPTAGSISLSGGTDFVPSVPASPGYTIVQTDVTAQYNFQQATQQALANQGIGATVVATVAAINESKLAANTMSQQTFTALLADQNVSNIERLLWNGSLVTAKALIQSVNLSVYYTSDEIASIVAMLP